MGVALGDCVPQRRRYIQYSPGCWCLRAFDPVRGHPGASSVAKTRAKGHQEGQASVSDIAQQYCQLFIVAKYL